MKTYKYTCNLCENSIEKTNESTPMDWGVVSMRNYFGNYVIWEWYICDRCCYGINDLCPPKRKINFITRIIEKLKNS